MKKGEFIDSVVGKTGETAKQAGQFYDAFWESIEDQLQKGKEVCLTGIGTFKVKKRAARKGINPATKKAINIPAKKVIIFKPSKTFSDRLNG